MATSHPKTRVNTPRNFMDFNNNLPQRTKDIQFFRSTEWSDSRICFLVLHHSLLPSLSSPSFYLYSCPPHCRRQLQQSYDVIIHVKHPPIKIIAFNTTFIYNKHSNEMVGPDSSVGIATRYGLDGPGIESRWGRDCPKPSRQALGTSQPSIKWVLVLLPGSKAAGA